MRIGSRDIGALEIKQHPWFRDIDFDLLVKKQITPPYIPKVEDQGDVGNVDPEFLNELP